MKRIRTQMLSLGCLLGLVLAGGSVVAGPIFGFENITNNNAGDAAIGEAQLTVELIDLGGGQVEFLFRNSGSAASSITEIYFDDGNPGVLSAPMGFTDIVGNVAFSQFATPPVLSGGADIGFVVTPGLSADSDAGSGGVMAHGVNPGEQLGLTLFGDLSDIESMLMSGDLRIGLHVIGFASGGSESFVNGISVVPAPSAALLVLVGLGTMLAKKRK